jgi:dephospho-CoA kinase
MIIVALTGSIAMGKSETAGMFRRLGCPVFDADEVVRVLYRRGGRAVKAVGKAFPEALVDGTIDRDRLAAQVVGNAEALKTLEAIVHPLVHRKERVFLKEARAGGRQLVVLDIPLLYETGGHDNVDKVVVVSAPAKLQRERALARPGMTTAKFEAIMARQIADEEKRRRADFVIDTSRGLDHAFEKVRAVVDRLLAAADQKGLGHA